MPMVFILTVCLDITNHDTPSYLKAQYYYITDIFVHFRVSSTPSLHYLLASKRLQSPWRQAPLSYLSLCLQHLVQCLVHSRCSVNVETN